MLFCSSRIDYYFIIILGQDEKESTIDNTKKEGIIVLALANLTRGRTSTSWRSWPYISVDARKQSPFTVLSRQQNGDISRPAQDGVSSPPAEGRGVKYVHRRVPRSPYSPGASPLGRSGFRVAAKYVPPQQAVTAGNFNCGKCSLPSRHTAGISIKVFYHPRFITITQLRMMNLLDFLLSLCFIRLYLLRVIRIYYFFSSSLFFFFFFLYFIHCCVVQQCYGCGLFSGVQTVFWLRHSACCTRKRYSRTGTQKQFQSTSDTKVKITTTSDVFNQRKCQVHWYFARYGQPTYGHLGQRRSRHV